VSTDEADSGLASAEHRQGKLFRDRELTLFFFVAVSFLVGGLRYSEQEFKQTAAQLNSSLLAMAVIAVLIPAGFHATLGESIQDPEERIDLLKVSRGVSVILLVIYGGYLFFSLSSHKQLYDDEEESTEEPTLNIGVAIGLLCVSTALVGVTSEWLVDSINGVTCTGALSQTWVGLILLPIVSNAAEHWSAVSGASKNKMDLAMGIAVGSSIQISTFVIPLLVIISWIAGKPLSLLFDPFIAILLFLAVLIVNYAISDGKSNYMEGWLLIMVYLIIALVTWFVEPSSASELFPDSVCS
jgi:Ca2+:H+ antiporter